MHNAKEEGFKYAFVCRSLILGEEGMIIRSVGR